MELAVSDHLHISNFISNILLFFAIAGLIVPLLERLKISSVQGYLICGIIVGPNGIATFVEHYHWISYAAIETPQSVKLMGEFGIIALMFMIGLELSFNRIKELQKFIFGIGSLQIIATAATIFVIALLFGNTSQASIILGVSFALSSTAIVMKLLEEQKLNNQPIGTLCFSVLLMQDLAVVPILVLTASLTGNSDTNILLALGTSLFAGIVTVGAIYWFGKKILTPILRSVSFSKNPEWLAAFMVFVVLTSAVITHAAGMSLALGAFMAGLLIAETEFKHEVEVIVSPLKGLLLGIFFLSIGMMIDLTEVFQHPFLLACAVAGLYLLKSTIMFFICLAFKSPAQQASQAALFLAQPGEFALMILGVAVSSQLMPVADVQFFLLVTVVAMMLTPLLFKLAPFVSQHFKADRNTSETTTDQLKIPTHKVVIAGFGRVGQLIAELLEQQGIAYIAFDNNGERVQELKKKNFHIIYADARKKELWQQLIGQHIETAVIAIDDHHATQPILKSLRTQFPLLPVIIRSKNTEDLKAFYEQGANDVVAETLESSLRIARLVIKKLGHNDDKEIEDMIEKIRSERIRIENAI